ncbi:MAG: hypothetical protein JO359_07070, partial [Candidatus Eremiobacteraeota bacterium]|nr:hypothetical protein [Candidatus Eremiobacteraeota bacterium]
MTALRLLGLLAATVLLCASFPAGASGGVTIMAQNAPAAAASAARGLSLANVDPTCKPCADFARYAMGGWQANNPIPPSESRWSMLDQLRESNLLQLREILEGVQREPWPHGSAAQKAGDYYASCTNVRERDAAGTAPIAVYLTGIREIRDLADLRLETAVLQNLGGHAFFFAGSEGDPRDEQRTIAVIVQGGLGLPDREFYFASDARAAQIRELYAAHVARYFALAGDDAASAAAAARQVLTVENALARVSRTRAERRDRLANYHKLSLAETQALIPSWDLTTFFRDRMAPRVDVVDVEQPDYLRGVEYVLRTSPLADLRAYLRYHLLERAAPVLSFPFAEEAAAFDAALTGRREPSPLWRRCVKAVDTDLGDAL